MVLTERAPAKVNLSLAVVGRRADGFHELVSVVAPISLSDSLTWEPAATESLACDDPTVPTDGSNLVLKAAAAYRRARPEAPVGRFTLAKRVPHGAGLGGGSSDAAAALRLLDRASGRPLGPDRLRAIAAGVGSDCPLFVDPCPCVLRGRGERVEPLRGSGAADWSGRRLLLAKPSFGVPTPEAYRWLAARGSYASPAAAEAALALALASGDPASVVALGNDLELPVFEALPALRQGVSRIRERLGLELRLTGSGSACFALVGDGVDPAAVREVLEPEWGGQVWTSLVDLA